MRAMKYGESRYRDPILLEDNYYSDYRYIILNLGTHPTAYVVLPKNNKLFGKNYDELDCISVHGGLTYSESYLTKEHITNHDNLYYVRDEWVLGWDYAHAYDYMGYYSHVEQVALSREFRKWKTSEIVEECKNVIRQLKEFEK